MMNHASTRRPQRRALETRARLIQSAIGEFAEKGFDGASTGEIASRAGEWLVAKHVAPQVRLTTGEDPFSEHYIKAHTEMILRLFIPSLE